MVKKISLSFIFSLALVFFTDFSVGNIKKISATMVTRSARGGRISNINAEICYLTSGKMISHFTQPFNQYILNTAKGEVSLYDPQKNTVAQQVNYLFSTETTQFFYFLNNQKSDLGLRNMGFIVKDTKFEKNLMITNWVPPTRLAKSIREIVMVHDGANPIYTKYIGGDGQLIKKVYYYNYKNLGAADFPQSITEIEYFSAKDSVISKTAYSDIKTNENATSKLFDFTIPANAKIIK
jgi:outer membrane lipoprotein-sorting protein